MSVQPKAVESVVALLISEIDISPDWNCRSNVESGSGGDESEDGEKTGFIGLRHSLATRGQDEAVIVRPHPDPKSKKPYHLVTGYRRVNALLANSVETDDKLPKVPNKHPTVNAVIRKMSEEAARELNMAENTARDDLSGPDLCYGVKRLLEVNPKATSVAIAQQLNMNQSYMARMMNIARDLDPKLLKDWRESAVKVSAKQMETISKAPKGEQAAKYNEAKQSKGGDDKVRGRNAWIQSTIKALQGMAVKLAMLSKAEALPQLEEEFFDVTGDELGGTIAVLVSIKKEATDNQRAKFTVAGWEAYCAALEAPEEGEETEEAPKAKKSAKGSKAKNGAAAQA